MCKTVNNQLRLTFTARADRVDLSKSFHMMYANFGQKVFVIFKRMSLRINTEYRNTQWVGNKILRIYLENLSRPCKKMTNTFWPEKWTVNGSAIGAPNTYL